MKIHYLLFAISLIVACSNEPDHIKDEVLQKQDTIKPTEHCIQRDTLFSFAEFDTVGYSSPKHKVELRIKNSGFEDSKLAIVKYNNKFGDTTDATAFILSQSGMVKEIELVNNYDDSIYFYINLYIPGGSMGNNGNISMLANIHSNEVYFYDISNYPDDYFVRTTTVKMSDNILFESFEAGYLYKKVEVILKKYELDESEKARYNFYLDNFTDDTESDKWILKFRKTKSKLFNTKPEQKNQEGSTVNARAENSRYVVTSVFRDATYCYDKQTKEYFCLWTTSSIYNNAYEIRFKGPNTVEILGLEHNISINLLTSECNQIEME